MNTAQLLAADPKASAWVAASAGTGKTKVLTDRLLNLMLEGFAPDRILCLTFTKAAAAEMANRLTERLASWATLSLPDLTQDLKRLLGKQFPSSGHIARARQLFTLVLDVPGGMRIQTIHGFCQSVLSRFPLEAGITPHFRVADDRLAEELFHEAQNAVFTNLTPQRELALAILNRYVSDLQFRSILNDFYQNRTRVLTLLNQYQTIQNYIRDLLYILNLSTIIQTPDEILDPNLLDKFKNQIVTPGDDFDSYILTYLTKTGEIRKRLSPEEQLEAERIYRLVRSLGDLEVTQKTAAFLILTQDILQTYQEIKTRRCVLDYDDLIDQTQKLLTQPGLASWVLYKLDGGIDHLLIDEAQDTNTAQWEIILKLTSEFFAPDKPYRTIFAVGDPKQSIYGFQGANPHEFLKLKDHFFQLAQPTGQDCRDVQLDMSYRSTAAVLSMVDKVFAHEKNRKGIMFNDTEIVHQVFRTGCLGHTELWPLITDEEDDPQKTNEDTWVLPTSRKESFKPQARLANYLADQVSTWLMSEMILPSTNQPIQPKDILILVRKRSSLTHEIIRALKQRNIPIAGADRLMLTDHIAVMDLLALGQFTLLPEDDLTLACILRCPLIGLEDEDLFTLAHDREGTLWQSLTKKQSQSPVFEHAYTWLKSCLREADLSPVYEFYSWVLTQGEGRQRILSRLGNEADDILEEFLNQALQYDQEHASSLQGFIHFMDHQSQDIKRDTSHTTSNQVRLMTVHGSKGLQAPVVILPDAADSGKKKWEPLLWVDDLIMIRPTQVQDSPKTKEAKAKEAKDIAHENQRLLYVALTRAQDHLYIGGWTSSKDLPENCWYKVIQEALDIHPQTDQKSLETTWISQSRSDESLPSWVYQSMESAEVKTELLAKPQVTTPAMERGILLHRLFEYLPQLPVEQRSLAACRLIEKSGENPKDWDADIQSTLHILQAPEFQDIFSPTSLSEVTIRGQLDGALFVGRIDRVVITSDTLKIVDYKTDQVVPTDLKDIPRAYIKQLDGYATALQSIYPHRKVLKYLLWTAGPRLQEVI